MIGDDFMQDVNKYIRHVMLEKEMTQNDMAKKMNMTRQNISRILSGDMKMSTLAAIAEALGCELEITFREKTE